MSDNPVLRYWPIIAFVATGLVGYGVTQNQINSNEKDIADAKTYAHEALNLAKRVESRVDVHDIKIEYQATQNAEILTSVKELTQSTNDLKVVIEGLKAEQRKTRSKQ